MKSGVVRVGETKIDWKGIWWHSSITHRYPPAASERCGGDQRGPGKRLAGVQTIMVVKRGPPTTVSLKFHLPVLLGAEWCPPSSAPGPAWTEANLNSASEISTSSGRSQPVPCSGIDYLHTILGDEAVAVKSLLVRCSPAPSSISPPEHSPATATATATGDGGSVPVRTPAAPADLWVELSVSNVRANSHISVDPVLLSAWRLLLPSLVTHTRDEARSPAAAQGERAAQEEMQKSGDRHKDVSEVRALEAVYASLKPATDARLDSACVGPAPGASGLNAVPAAVVMKGI